MLRLLTWKLVGRVLPVAQIYTKEKGPHILAFVTAVSELIRASDVYGFDHHPTSSVSKTFKPLH